MEEKVQVLFSRLLFTCASGQFIDEREEAVAGDTKEVRWLADEERLIADAFEPAVRLLDLPALHVIGERLDCFADSVHVLRRQRIHKTADSLKQSFAGQIHAGSEIVLAVGRIVGSIPALTFEAAMTAILTGSPIIVKIISNQKRISKSSQAGVFSRAIA